LSTCAGIVRLRLHMAQEEELYVSLGDETGIVDAAGVAA
jgi:hypothetical protein